MKISTLVDKLSELHRLRCGSLIITFFGDYILPRGGAIWLSSITELFEHLGLNSRMVRTAIFRLKKDGWLDSVQSGRNSQYSISREGYSKFHSASNRIYSSGERLWRQNWDLIIAKKLNKSSAAMLSRELIWMGFGRFASGIYAHPKADRTILARTLQQLKLENQVVHMTMEAGTLNSADTLREMVNNIWHLQHIGDLYSQFVKIFKPIHDSLADDNQVIYDDADYFALRLLLIHYYRWILLRDPELPQEILPAPWSGNDARQLCRNIYLQVYQQADRYINSHASNNNGALPFPDEAYYQRYGGLSRD